MNWRIKRHVGPAARIDRVLEFAREIDEQDKAFVQTIRAEDPREIRRRGSDEI